jgi:SAM-dependent methyltransferase
MSSDRPGKIADDLYLKRGAADADHRCEVNLRNGDFDLGDALLGSLSLKSGETLLDVGCGSGRLLERFAVPLRPDGSAKGFDISKEAVETTRSRGLEAEVADAAELPVSTSCADALTCVFAIYYHDDLFAVLNEFSRTLRSTGRLAIAGPASNTNRELYQFHKKATGADPSDADTMALGFVENRVKPVLGEAGFAQVQLATHKNRIRFSDSSSFLDYWEATSLFARTPGASRSAGERALEDHRGELTVTKFISLLTAVRI